MNRTSGASTICVLLVTNDPATATRLEDELFDSDRLAVTTVETVADALSRFRDDEPVDCLVSEYDLRDTDGIAFLQAVRAQAPTLPFFLLTAEECPRVASRAISAAVTEHLVDERGEWDSLADVVEDAVRYHRRHGRRRDRFSRAKASLEAAPDPIVVCADGRVAYVTESGCELFGADDRDVLLGRSVEALFETDGEPFAPQLAAVESGVRTLERSDVGAVRSDHGTRPVELTALFLEWRDEPAVALVIRPLNSGRAEQASGRTLQRAIDVAGHAVYLTARDGTITYVNAAFEELTGYEREEALGETPDILHSGEMPSAYFRRLWATLEDGEIWHERITNRRASGETYVAQQTIAPVVIGGEIDQFVAIQTDVTERVELERRLEQYRSIVELLEDPIMLQDREGAFVLANEAVCDFAGYSPGALRGEDESLFMADADAEEIDSKKAEVLDSGESVEYEVAPSFLETDRAATFSTRRYPYYGPDGTLDGTIAICRDVTDLKGQEQQLRQYRRAVEGATDLIAAVDRNRRFRFANPNYCAYHGIEADDVTSLTLPEVIGENAYAVAEPRITRALTGETVDYRITRSHPERGDRILDVKYYPLVEDGSVTGVVGVFRDVTESEERARQLRVIDRVLRHNLRNDLTVIRGLADRIADRTDGDVATDATDIVGQADQLLTTSRKSRHITRVLSEQPQLEVVDLTAVVQDVASTVADLRPDVSIEHSTPERIPVAVAPAVTEAIEEVAVNAVIHNDSDEPRLALSVDVDADGVTVAITDNGPGISSMDRNVLERGSETDDLYHGSGLGLWLVYWIVHRSGGTARVSDAEPTGTTVTMTFPYTSLE